MQRSTLPVCAKLVRVVENGIGRRDECTGTWNTAMRPRNPTLYVLRGPFARLRFPLVPGPKWLGPWPGISSPPTDSTASPPTVPHRLPVVSRPA